MTRSKLCYTFKNPRHCKIKRVEIASPAKVGVKTPTITKVEGGWQIEGDINVGLVDVSIEFKNGCCPPQVRTIDFSKEALSTSITEPNATIVQGEMNSKLADMMVDETTKRPPKPEVYDPNHEGFEKRILLENLIRIVHRRLELSDIIIQLKNTELSNIDFIYGEVEKDRVDLLMWFDRVSKLYEKENN